MSRFFRTTAFYLLIFLVLVGLFSFFSDRGQEAEELHYNELLQMLQADQVESLEVNADAGVWHIEGIAEEGIFEEGVQQFTAQAPMQYDAFLNYLEQAGEAGVEIDYIPDPGDPFWLTAGIFLIPILLIIFLFIFLMSQSQGGGNKVMNFGKSKAKLVQEDKKGVTFKDVAGAEEEKQELMEVVDFLKDPRKFSAVGARIPKGLLLVGPPGTGKTLLGRAVAGEAGTPFFSISGSDFVEMFVGVGASRVRDLFENAKKNSPCIIFMDEIDAVGRQRGAGLGGGHDEREQTLNQLLVEMDGFAANEGIIIMAATNRPDVLDPALLRPGRFDRQITVNRPDLNGRIDVLKVHARNKPISDNVDMEVVARRTPGFSGADLENLLNEAALLAARREKKEIAMAEIDDAVDRVIAGTEKRSRKVSEKERKIVSYHESGHTIVGYFLPDADLVHKVTIVPRGQAGGFMVPLPKEERFIYTEPELKDRIAGLLGGRVAEEVVFGEVSVGAVDDFRKATGLARKMVTEFGMSKLGPIQFGEPQGQVFLGRDLSNDRNYSDAIAYEIDQEVHRIITEQYDRAKELIHKQRDKLEVIAQKLLDIETLTSDQIEQLINKGELSADPASQTEKEDSHSDTAHREAKVDEDQVRVQIQTKKEEDSNLLPKEDHEQDGKQHNQNDSSDNDQDGSAHNDQEKEDADEDQNRRS